MCRRIGRMDRKRIIILCLAVFLVFGGTAVFLSMDTESIASVIETTVGDGTQSPRTESLTSTRHLKVPIGNILLKPPEDMSGKRTPVDFPHSRHFSYTCRTCHHKWLGDAELQTCSSQKCHDQVERPKRPGRKTPEPDYDIAYFKKAYHQQCITCHKAIKQQNKELEELSAKPIYLLKRLIGITGSNTLTGKLTVVGPTSCVKCHPENKE